MNTRTVGLAALGLLLPLSIPAPAATQVPAPAQVDTADAAAVPDFLNERGPRAEIMFVGTFHFAYPERDVVKSTSRVEVLDPTRQREIETLVERLGGWAPTRVAVEWPVEEQARLDSLYDAYLAGALDLPRNEVFQVGFRLGRRLGLDRVDAVDVERSDVLLDLAQRQLEPREAELMATDSAWRRRFARLRAYEDSVNALRYRTIGDMLAEMNTERSIRRSHLPYSVGFFKFDGEPGGYAGADFVAGWYDRNLRIFRNLQRITRGPDERILVLIGAGHLPILRFVTDHSPEYRLVDASRFLPPPPAAATLDRGPTSP